MSGGFFYSNKWLKRFHGHGTDLESFYNLRLSNKFSFGQDVTISPRINYTGFATKDTLSGNPIFALRNVHTVESIFNLKYTFNTVMGLNVRLRHYWSKLNNKTFFDLNKQGDLVSLTSANFDHHVDQNYNAWNIDMVYLWQFSPGIRR